MVACAKPLGACALTPTMPLRTVAVMAVCVAEFVVNVFVVPESAAVTLAWYRKKIPTPALDVLSTNVYPLGGVTVALEESGITATSTLSPLRMPVGNVMVCVVPLALEPPVVDATVVMLIKNSPRACAALRSA